MYTYRIRGKRGRFKIILPLLFVPSWRYQACPVLRHHFQITYIFIRSWTGMFMRISIATHKYWLSGIVHFLFFGKIMHRYCTFLDFQNRFNKVCRIVFRFVHRPLADSFRRNLLQKWQCQCLSGFLRVFQDLKSGAHPYLPYDLAVCSCMDIIYIRFSVTYFLYSFHSAWSFLFSLERALPEKFHFFIEKIIRKSKQTSHFNGMFITQSRDCQ